MVREKRRTRIILSVIVMAVMFCAALIPADSFAGIVDVNENDISYSVTGAFS